MKKILIVDDERPISDIIKFNLSKEGYSVVTAFDGIEALEVFDEEAPDLVILDLMLPLKDGLEVAREIRKKDHVPIIMVSAKDTEFDKVIGLEIGADDYVTKPFSNRELLARVKAQLRRAEKVETIIMDDLDDVDALIVHDMKIIPETFTVRRAGRDVELTHREFDLLYYLATHIGQVMSREHLLATVWGFDYYGDVRTVDVTVRRLREKIENNPSRPEYILTRRGVGYYMREYDV